MSAIKISYQTLEALYGSAPGSSNGSSIDQETARKALDQAIEQAFGNGQDALGVIIVEGLPSDFPSLRSRLLHLAAKFADLPEAIREKYARKDVEYMFGWSHGKEVMNGKPDVLKGSYYANPLLDNPDVSAEMKEKYPVYYGENVWPEKTESGMQDFEVAFKELGRFIFNVGILLAKACEKFVSPQLQVSLNGSGSESAGSSSSTTFADMIASSRCNKARLLHYFPPTETTTGKASQSEDDVVVDDACGLHLDHSLLTGLCSAMYLKNSDDGKNEVVSPPDPTAGLWIQPRREGAKPIKVAIPADCLAFQTGEALQLITGGQLAATPHFVRAGSDASNISRETFAFFLQPDVDRVIHPSGETFGLFTERIIREHSFESVEASGSSSAGEPSGSRSFSTEAIAASAVLSAVAGKVSRRSGSRLTSRPASHQALWTSTGRTHFSTVQNAAGRIFPMTRTYATFPSKPLNPSSSSLLWAKRLRNRPFVYFGLPFLSIVVVSSFALQSFTQTRYDLHDTKVQTVSKEEQLGMDKNRKKVDIREEYYRLQGLGVTNNDSWDQVRVPRPKGMPEWGAPVTPKAAEAPVKGMRENDRLV